MPQRRSLLIRLLLVSPLFRPSSCSTTPQQIVDVACDHVRKSGIPMTSGVFVDSSGVLKEGSLRLRSSFLSLKTALSVFGEDRYTTSPLLLDALTSCLLIVVLFKLHIRSDVQDLTQNIHHGCLLQIILADKASAETQPSWAFKSFRTPNQKNNMTAGLSFRWVSPDAAM